MRPGSPLAWAIQIGSLVTAAMCMGPWWRVRSSDLFGTTGEVAAYLTHPGLVTLLGAALTMLIVAAERGTTPARETREAFAGGALVTSLLAAGVLVVQLLSGPAPYRSAPTERTAWFYVAVAAAVVSAGLAAASWGSQRRASSSAQ